MQLNHMHTCAEQVASFCGTVMAAQQLAQGLLPVGHTLAESELLLQQTQEALSLGLRCACVCVCLCVCLCVCVHVCLYVCICECLIL